MKEKIWNLIREQLPKAKLHVYGAYISPKVQNLHNEKEGFIVHGRANDAFEVIQEARAVLAPIRFGAGIKGKFLDAMRCGTPSVTTSVGAEDMILNNEWSGGLGNTPEEIATAAIELYTNENLWQEKQQIGFDTIEWRYNAETYLTAFDVHLNTLYQNLESHRSLSFTSKLMQQQTVMSAHYMSLWIMEKTNSKIT